MKTVAEMKARIRAINTEAKTATGEALATLLEELEDLNTQLAEAADRARIAAAAEQAGEEGKGEEGKGEEGGQKASARTKRGEALKAKKQVNYTAAAHFKISAAVTSDDAVLPKHTASDVAPAFNEVSSLVDRVKAVPLPGGESYERGFVKGYGEGGETGEGQDYTTAEPVFGYAKMTKSKVTAYAEQPEEIDKLAPAAYDGIVEEGTVIAVKKRLSRQILVGQGGDNQLRGIFFNPADAKERVIDPATDIAVSAIDADTLDDIVYSYGGDEDVEDIAVLILNKIDLAAFAKVKDKQGRKVYTIKNHGNTGTIDEVPFVINSACKAVSDGDTADGAYCMAYGPLEAYEMPIFSDIEVKKADQYKFKQGQIAFKSGGFFGGNVARWNGFLRVKKGAAT